MNWRVELLGGLRATCGDFDIAHFRSRKTASLLAYIAFFRGAHPRDQLVDLFWPNSSLEAGRNSLRVALSDLQKRTVSFEPNDSLSTLPLLEKDRTSIALHRSVVTDVGEFENAITQARKSLSVQTRIDLYERAMSLYKGALLPGFYDDWIPVEEARLEFAFLHVLKVLTEHAASMNDRPRVLELEQLAARLQPTPLTARRVEVLDDVPLPIDRSQLVSSAISSDTASVPSSFTRFFGRESDLQQLLSLVADGGNRIITLTGGGGLGKTRLALELAGRLGKLSHSQGKSLFARVLWVSLADVNEAELLLETLVKAFDLPAESLASSGHVPTLRQRLVHFLKRDEVNKQRVLVVLDNFEQLLPQGSALLGQLLESVPSLSIIVTSRKRLDLSGENEYRLTSLSLPTRVDSGAKMSEGNAAWNEEQLAILRASSSVQLFADRARAARAGWRLAPREAPDFIALLQRLEGMPLAIELVASRAGVLSVEQMLSRLTQSWQWVSSRDQHRPLRHRSLDAVLDWSLELILPHERAIFARLSVFHGGWTLDDAGAVLTDVDSTDLLDALQSLRDASLIASDESKGGELRFSMLEMVRQIAGERLDEAERWDVRRRHAEFYLDLAQASVRIPTDEKGRLFWSRAEGPNFLAALDFWMDSDVERALEMASSLWWYWIFDSHLPEGRHYFKNLLSRTGAADFPSARSRAQGCAAYIALLSGYHDEAEQLLRSALKVWEQEKNTHELVSAFNLLGAVAHARGELQTSRDLYEQSLNLRRQTGTPREMAISINALADIEREYGNRETAQRLCDEVMQLADENHDEGARAWALQTLGLLARDEGNWENSRFLLKQSLRLRQQAEHLRAQVTCLDALGDIARQQGDYEAAYDHYQSALGLLRQTNRVAQIDVLRKKMAALEC